MHDQQRGALTLVRVLSGKLKKGDKIITSNGCSEVVQRIYEPLADEYREITHIDRGNVGICAGLQVNHLCHGILYCIPIHCVKVNKYGFISKVGNDNG